jgi:hypothetical protein
MPIEYDIIEDKKLVLVKGSGVITAIDVIEHLDRLVADNRYTSPMKKLVDYRLVEDIKITPEEAKGIAHKKQLLSRTIFLGERCAFVSPEDATYGTSRVHQALSESSSTNTKVFRQIENAVGWLDISLDMLT